MDIAKRTLTTTEESVLKNDLLDVQDWVTKAIDGKASKCKKRMIAEWLPKLYADDSVSSIPASEDEIVAMIVARDDYENRVVRDQGYPEGDPSDSWELAQLQKYCDDNDIEHYPEAVEAVEAQDAVLDEDGEEVSPAVEAVEAQDADTKASLLAAIEEASNE